MLDQQAPHQAIVIYSPDEAFGRDVSSFLGESYRVLITTQTGQLRMLLAEPEVCRLVLDCRRLQAVQLESLEQLLAGPRFDHARTLLLVSEGNRVPDDVFPAAQRVRASQGTFSVEQVVERLLAQDEEPSEATAVEDVAPAVTRTTADRDKGAAFGEVVFEGVTRRFETRSPELKRMLDDLMVAASHDVTILLIGETGSGKTYLSNLIHEASPRRTEPFLHVACGALPRELIESELFGHIKGAFTSAHADKEGKFVAARQGTILLDEIDVLGLEQQVKLLRVIETGEFEPVGSNQTRQSQARLVVASNLDLEPLVEQGRFRPDVYYRLNMLKFEIPPLRKRKMDIIPLAKKFVSKFQQKHQIEVHRIEDAVLETLLAYPWPGNVRELEHVIQRAVIYCRTGVLTRDQLPPHLLSGEVGPTNDPSVRLGGRTQAEQSLEKQVAVTEKDIIEQALFKNNFSRTKTATDLGISRVTLYNKMKKYEMLK